MDRLNEQQWAQIYNEKKAKMVFSDILKGKLSAQTEEMIKIVKKEKVNYLCEIGCGSGQTVVVLALHGINVVAVDYQEESLRMVKQIAEYAGSEVIKRIETVCCDAQEGLPFSVDQFDIIYHAGLLEHYSYVERVKMLNLWKNYCAKMVSMVPNGASVAYRYGKEKMINNGTWPYGIENIIYTQIMDFIEAGLIVDEEYTIGVLNSMNFLDKKNYLKKAMTKLWNENFLHDDCHQGYLLVTRGRKKE